MALLDGVPENLPLPQQMLLPHEVIEGLGPHPFSQGGPLPRHPTGLSSEKISRRLFRSYLHPPVSHSSRGKGNDSMLPAWKEQGTLQGKDSPQILPQNLLNG